MNQKTKTLTLVVLYLLPLAAIHVLTGIKVTPNDEFVVAGLLRNGEPLVLIVNFVTANILVYLYEQLPAIQWYSVFITLNILFAVVFWVAIAEELLTKYGENRESDKLRNGIYLVVLHMFGLSVFCLLYLTLSITSLTILYISLSVPWAVLKGRNIILYSSWALMLRTEVAVFLLPVFWISVLYRLDWATFRKKLLNANLLLPFILISAAYFSLSSEDREWLEFNEERAGAMDFSRFAGIKEELPERELEKTKALNYYWYLHYDNSFTSGMKYGDEKQSDILKYIDKITLNNIYNVHVKSKNRQWIAIFYVCIFICLLVYATRHEKMPRMRLVFTALSFIALFILLILQKDAFRVTFWMLLGFTVSVLVYTSLSTKVIPLTLMMVLSVVLLDSAWAIHSQRSRNSSSIDRIFVAYTALANQYAPKRFIPSIRFPHGLAPHLVKFMLFHEDKIPTLFDQPTGLMPSGWMAGHPYFKRIYCSLIDADEQNCQLDFEQIVTSGKVLFVADSRASEMTDVVFDHYHKLTGCKYTLRTIEEIPPIGLYQVEKTCAQSAEP